MSSIWDRLKIWEEDALSWFGGAVQSEAAAVAPIVEANIANLSAAEAEAIATGNSSQTGHILAGVMSKAAQDLEVAGIKAAAPSLLMAVGKAAANAPQLVANKS